MVIIKEAQRQQEEAESQRSGGHSPAGGGGQMLNGKKPGTPGRMGGGAFEGETVEYVNEGAK
jgi:hypothetical protein